MTIYEEATAKGIPTDHHESDLYLPVTYETRALIRAHGVSATVFRSQIDGALWFDVPFRFDPWWSARAR